MLLNIGKYVIDLSYPISSFIALFIGSSIITYSIYLADYITTHGIDTVRIKLMAIIAYVAIPALSSITLQYITGLSLSQSIIFAINIFLPPFAWILMGQFFLRNTTNTNKIIITLVGYVIFLLLEFINLRGIIISLIGH